MRIWKFQALGSPRGATTGFRESAGGAEPGGFVFGGAAEGELLEGGAVGAHDPDVAVVALLTGEEDLGPPGRPRRVGVVGDRGPRLVGGEPDDPRAVGV